MNGSCGSARIAGGWLFVAILLSSLVGCERQTETPPRETGGAQQVSQQQQQPPGTPQQPSGQPGRSPAGAPVPMLVPVEELTSRLNESNLRVLDARDVEAYAAGHIPGAVWVETDQWKEQSLAENGLRDATFWAEHVGQLGIDATTNVVVYSQNPTDAARVWWTLKYVGVPNVALLDGGWTAWQQAGGAASTDETEIAARSFTPSFQTDRLTQIGDLKQSLKADDVVVIDARSIGEFSGTSGPGTRQGRIPGATHIEWTEFLDADNRFKSPAEIQAILAEKGVTGDKTVVTHCQSGGRAALDAFALELAGIKNVRNYYCGWSEWSKDEAAPVEKPSDGGATEK
ncbi:MAG: sulfurtransferase [Planctomycetaceae bacterium]